MSELKSQAGYQFLYHEVCEERTRLRAALDGVKERVFVDGRPCWCPDWRYEEFHESHDDPAEWAHHEACQRARDVLAGAE